VQRELIAGLAVDGFDGDSDNNSNANFTAHTCINENVGGGIVCSADQILSGSTQTGDFSVWLDSTRLSVLQDTSNSRAFWYGTVIVTIPPHTSGWSYFQGLFMTT
jgi:hypothetical protein